MKKRSVDINCDLGEVLLSSGNNFDAKLMPNISRCNIACGGHAGDPETMEYVVDLAIKYKVKIGAHPSYPDKTNFGRVSLDISDGALKESVLSQISQLKTICDKKGVVLTHIKPHGALYNDLARDESKSRFFAQIISAFNCDWMGLANSESQKIALEQEYNFIAESFADRRYHTNGKLTSRNLDRSVLENREEVIEQVSNLILNNKVKTLEEEYINISSDSICVHSDTEGSIELLTEIHNFLNAQNLLLEKSQ